MPKQHTVTRQCPHRWCRRLHSVIAACGAVALLIIAIHQLSSLLFFLAITALTVALVAVITRRSFTDIATADLPPIVPLHVRRGWAHLAVAFDLFMVICGPLAITSMLLTPSAEVGAQLTDAAYAWSTVVSVLAYGVSREVAHWLATRPARPKRVRVPSAA